MQPVVVSARGGAALSRLHLILFCICVFIIHAFVIVFKTTVASLSFAGVDFLNARCVGVVAWLRRCIAIAWCFNVCFFCSGMCIATAGVVQKYEIAVWP